MKTILLLLSLLTLNLNAATAQEPPLPECSTEITDIKHTEKRLMDLNCQGCLSAISIEWRGYAGNYEVEYGPKGFERGQGSDKCDKGRSECWIDQLDLLPLTEYDFYVRAKCGDTFGEWMHYSFVTPYDTGRMGIEGEEVKTFTIRFNPDANNLSIDLSESSAAGKVQVEIVDMNGVTRQKYAYQNEYDLSSLPAGMYVVKVTVDSNTDTRIIQIR